MRYYLALIVLVFVYNISIAQNPVYKPKDNNPRLTREETALLNQHTGQQGFDFENKKIGFIQLSRNGWAGTGIGISRSSKMLFFTAAGKYTAYRLYVLSDSQQRQTNGYDAVLVFGDKGYSDRLNRLKEAKVLDLCHNRYPDIPEHAGTDTNALLTSENAAFFNALYAISATDRGIDFNGKKVAIFESCGSTRKFPVRKTIPEYVNQVTAEIRNSGSYASDFVYELTPSQKKESGGYDIIIRYLCKFSVPLERLISLLGESKG